MLTKNGISIITNGMTQSCQVSNSIQMKAQPTQYLWLKSPSGKWMSNDSNESDNDFIWGTSDNPLNFSNNTEVVTNTNYLLQNNNDLDDAVQNNNTSATFCPYTLLLGTGTTSPTVNDYKLVNCETRYTRQQESITFDPQNLQCQVSLIVVPSTNITINEIGCYLRCFTAYDHERVNTNLHCLSLIDRKVLAQPLSLSAGKVTTITYTIDFRNINEATV